MNKGIFKKILIIFIIVMICFGNVNLIFGQGTFDNSEEIPDDDSPDDDPSDDDPPGDDSPGDTPPGDTTPGDDTSDDPDTLGNISGKVWEDDKDKHGITNEYGITNGDGIYQDDENLIGGITVNLYNENHQLVGLPVTTSEDGTYTFSNVEPGKYKVEFVYGNNKDNLKYNGQDYKSSVSYEISESITEITDTSIPNNKIRDIVFVIDLSESMEDYISDLKESLKNACESLLDDYTNISIWTYSTIIHEKQFFSNDFNEISKFINEFRIHNRTNTTKGLEESYNYMLNNSRKNSIKYLILFTDGIPTVSDNKIYSNDALYNECKNSWDSINNINKLAICFGSDPVFEQIFGESGKFENIDNLPDNFQASIENFISVPSISTSISTITSDGYSYATDSQERRLDVMNYAMNIDYTNGSILNIDNSSNIDDFITNTYMIASTSYFNVSSGENVQNMNLALEKRPKASVEIKKNVSHLTVILSDGSPLIDWDINDYNNNIIKKHLMYIPDNSLTAIMDDEITHGATIKIKYDITVKNTSESDSLFNYFTSTFIIENQYNPRFTNWFNLLNVAFSENVTTTFYLYDYLGNNLIFDENNNPDNWSFVNNDNLLPHSDNMDLSTLPVLVNEVTLKPGETKPLTLNASKVMTIADTDLLTYDNYIEVVAYKNILGKILTYDDELNNRKILTPGNLNIYDDNREYEPDEAKAETVTRVPPFGKDLSYYTTIVGIIILAIEIAVLSTLKIKIKHLRSRYIRR